RSLIELWPAVLAISLLVIFGKTLAVSFGALVAGQNSRAALFSGVSMTQIGEFSFIIASLGLSLHVISERLYPIAVAVSLITSCLTPLWLKRAGKIHEWIEKIMPWGLRQGMQRYEDTVRINRGRGALPSLLSAYLPPIVVNLVMILATTGIARALLYPQIEAMWGPSPQVRLLGLLAGFALGLPFYWGLCLGRPAKSWREKAHEFPRLYWVEMFLALARIGLALMLFLFSVAQYLSWKSLSGLTIFMLLGSAALFYAFGGKIYVRLEKRFLGQLKPGAEDKAPEPALLPWDTHLTELVVAPESQACGKTILNMGLGESFGVMIAAIDRGRRRILAPKGSDFVFPGDKLSVIGGDADIERLRRLVEGVDGIAEPEQPLALQSVILSADSELRGKSIRESQLRDRVHGLLVGIERKGYRQLNPSPDLRLEAGDRLWIVGDAQRIAELNP
ncbi:MAG TPA: TrkA C-terminal domain-containing protein, partial [Bdellovibrionales bacterium]|nr:TrkA C-terminal domain-containing protein [Bdellovibrionales bacterium]